MSMVVKLILKAYKVAHYLYPTANIERGDIRNYKSPVKMDYVVQNPPFNLSFKTQEGIFFLNCIAVKSSSGLEASWNYGHHRSHVFLS